MFPQQRQQPKPKKQNDDCVIDVKKTPHGKRITVKGKCTKEKIEAAKQSTNLD